MPRAVSGSSGSYPTITSRSFARSVTVRAIGPSDPLISGQPSNMPPRLTSPAVGLIPTTEFQVDGRESTQTLLHRQRLLQSLPKAPRPIRRMNRRPFDPTRKDSVLSRTASHGYLLLPIHRALSFPE